MDATITDKPISYGLPDAKDEAALRLAPPGGRVRAGQWAGMATMGTMRDRPGKVGVSTHPLAGGWAAFARGLSSASGSRTSLGTIDFRAPGKLGTMKGGT